MNSNQAGSKAIPPRDMPPPLPPEEGSQDIASANADKEHGEGSYKGTKNYQDSVKSYLKTADVEKDARDAAPRTAEEQRQLEEAEKAGKAPAAEK